MLLELGVGEDQVKIQEMTFQSIKLPDYLAVNPMGTSPSFKDGDLCLFESGAITSHLLETFDTEHKLHPAIGSPTRALYHQVPKPTPTSPPRHRHPLHPHHVDNANPNALSLTTSFKSSTYRTTVATNVD
eukprot:6335827-Pyramimonas_sp.AAC.2